MKKIVQLLVLFLFLGVQAQEKLSVSVLFVGYDPNIPLLKPEEKSSSAGVSLERFEKDYKTRYPAFMDYLDVHFTKVKGVDVRSYNESMSNGFDVTIFDQTPPPINPPVIEKDENGKIMKYVAAQYITKDFDHATIFMAEVGPQMGENIGLKLDWLCQCLDADAFEVQTEHAIFKGPLPVNLTFNEKPTPKQLLRFSLKKYTATLPMWRVQKEGYKDGNDYRVGMVSNGEGFLDSPDTEIISNGVHTKVSEAVAIGRHGNFLLWGFSGSPDYMTDEAKKVFANIIVYMKQFKGKKPLARKYDRYIGIRDYVIDGAINALTREKYEIQVEETKEFNAKIAEKRKELLLKKENGETLSEMDMMLIQNDDPMPTPSWNEYIGYFMLGYEDRFGVDIEAFKKFLIKNRRFVGYNPKNKQNSFIIDEEVKSLGISNREVVFLETCIDLLYKPEKKDLAQRLLKRYTSQDFTLPKDWKHWFESNKDNLFFSEAAGYKWLVNTLQ